MGIFRRRAQLAPPHSPTLVLSLLVKRSSGKKACRIEIRSDQSIAELDSAIRQIMGYDTWDHCSAFFQGKAWRSPCLAEVYTDASGPNQNMAVSGLLSPEDTLTYVYDFGDNIEHSVILENLLPVDPSKHYPASNRVKLSSTRKSKNLTPSVTYHG